MIKVFGQTDTSFPSNGDSAPFFKGESTSFGEALDLERGRERLGAGNTGNGSALA